jgi:hypothetical protein
MDPCFVESNMLAEISNSEQLLLLELIESAKKTMLHEIDHTDTREYRRKLQERIKLLDGLAEKIQAPIASQA